MWKLKDPEIKDVLQFVMNNTGMTKNELMNNNLIGDIPELDAVADEFRKAARDKIPMHFVTDYDVDGQGCSFIANQICVNMGIPYTIYIPKRFEDGYGLNPHIVDKYSDGYLVTCDNGIVAFDAIKKAKDKGLKVIILDHHGMSKDGKLPDADFIVDPSHEALPGKSTVGEVCATGILLFLAKKLIGDNKEAMDRCFCMGALATICDVMPLTGDNRVIVKKGVECLMDYSRRTKGMGALLRATGDARYVTSVGISFGIGPAINACSRLEGTNVEIADDPYSKTKGYTVTADAMMVYNLLTRNFTDYKSADNAAREVQSVNNLRKVMKFDQTKEAFKIIEKDLLYSDAPIIVYSPHFHLGLVGIIAGQITEKYGVPAIVLCDDPKNPLNIKGSARSIPKINIKSVLDDCAEDLVGYGGHAGAAGLSLNRANLNKFREDANRVLENEEFDKPESTYDFEITEDQIESVLDVLDVCQPFGNHNPEPVFLLKNFKPYPVAGTSDRIKYVGNEHVILQGKAYQAPAFFLRTKFDEEIHDLSYLDVLCTLDWSYDKMGNKSPKIMIKDVREALSPPMKKHSAMFERFARQVNK